MTYLTVAEQLSDYVIQPGGRITRPSDVIRQTMPYAEVIHRIRGLSRACPKIGQAPIYEPKLRTSSSGLALILWIDRSAPRCSSSGVRRMPTVSFSRPRTPVPPPKR